MKFLAIIFICVLRQHMALTHTSIEHHSHENHSHEQNHHSRETQFPISSEEMFQIYVNEDTDIPVSATLQVIEDSSSCDPPNGMGFHSLMRKSAKLLPLKEIQKIIAAAIAHDPEVRQLRDLVRSENFRQLVKDVRASPELSRLSGFVCKKMRYDLKHYQKFVSKIFGSDLFSSEQNDGEAFKGRPGVSGLLKDIREVMPWRDLKQQAERLLREDQYLRLAREQFRSRQFAKLLQNVKGLPKYQEMKKQLRSVGLKGKDFRDMIETSLGWKFGIDFEVMGH